VLLKLLVRNHDNLFVLAEIAHFSGIGFLLYKLTRVESCAGAPLSQAGPLVGLSPAVQRALYRFATARLAPAGRATGALLRPLCADASRCARAPRGGRASAARSHFAEEPAADGAVSGHPAVLQLHDGV
jgi:hypothetical protein